MFSKRFVYGLPWHDEDQGDGDQALNDATSGQMGEEPRPEHNPQPFTDSQNADLRENDSRRRTAHKMSREIQQSS